MIIIIIIIIIKETDLSDAITVENCYSGTRRGMTARCCAGTITHSRYWILSGTFNQCTIREAAAWFGRISSPKTRESSCGVQNGLQPVEKISGHSGKDRVAVIHLAQHECMNQREQRMSWQWTSDATNLTESGEASSDGWQDVRPHTQVSIDINAEVVNRSDWQDWQLTNTKLTSWQQMLTPLWCAPQHLSLGVAELQPICS